MSDATVANIVRKTPFVDRVQPGPDGKPLPSWIELSISDLCNRACPFCPRVDDAVYPNANLNMATSVAVNLAEQLHALRYEGSVVLCGYGEPTMHPRLLEIVHALAGFRLEVVSNGDRLNPDMIRDLIRGGVDHIAISMYDGEHQIEKFRSMFAAAGTNAYSLRDRWQSEQENFGLSFLTNRAGTIDVGIQATVDTDRPCFYLAYSLIVDWQGDVLLCVQDWNKRVRFGNVVHDGLYTVWNSPAMRKRRMQLLRGRAGLHPCSSCNANGQVHGAEHAIAWRS